MITIQLLLSKANEEMRPLPLDIIPQKQNLFSKTIKVLFRCVYFHSLNWKQMKKWDEAPFERWDIISQKQNLKGTCDFSLFSKTLKVLFLKCLWAFMIENKSIFFKKKQLRNGALIKRRDIISQKQGIYDFSKYVFKNIESTVLEMFISLYNWKQIHFVLT